MYILVACEESQVVCLAFRNKGHNAFSCDLQHPSGGHPEWHILGDVLPLLNGHCDFQTMDGKYHSIPGAWDMLIAHPPCTYLARVGASNIPKHPERIELGFAARDFFMQFYNADIERICIENPIPMSRFNLPKPSMRFQPYEFYSLDGENDYSKYTYLWLKGLPPLLPTCDYDRSYKFPSWCKLHEGGIKDRAKIRSKTFPGVALAMAAQWG